MRIELNTRSFFKAFTSLFVFAILLAPSTKAQAIPSLDLIEDAEINSLATKKFKFMYFSGQPEAADIEEMGTLDFTALINLQRFDENPFDDQSLTTSLGINYHQVPLLDKSGKIITENLETLEKLHKTYHDLDHLIYCRSGNRAGAWFALHLIIKHDAPVEDAITFGNALGLKSERLRNEIRAFANSEG